MVREGAKQINISTSPEKYHMLEDSWTESGSEKTLSGWILEIICSIFE